LLVFLPIASAYARASEMNAILQYKPVQETIVMTTENLKSIASNFITIVVDTMFLIASI
jgi:hypothetical protein